MLTATCSNAEGLLAIRFFLGAAEAAIGPGLTVIVAMWYKRSEQPLRHGAWFMGNVVAGIFGGVLAYGVGHVRSIEAWKVGLPIHRQHTHTDLTFRLSFCSSARSL
jgi:MFS family permease